MKVFKIKKKDSEEFYNSSSQAWEETGTNFATINAAKRSAGHKKKTLNRYIRWYAANNSQQVERYKALIAEIDSATIIEYELTEVQQYSISGVGLEEPTTEEIKDEEEIKAIEKLEKIDFSSI